MGRSAGAADARREVRRQDALIAGLFEAAVEPDQVADRRLRCCGGVRAGGQQLVKARRADINAISQALPFHLDEEGDDPHAMRGGVFRGNAGRAIGDNSNPRHLRIPRCAATLHALAVRQVASSIPPTARWPKSRLGQGRSCRVCWGCRGGRLPPFCSRKRARAPTN